MALSTTEPEYMAVDEELEVVAYESLLVYSFSHSGQFGVYGLPWFFLIRFFHVNIQCLCVSATILLFMFLPFCV